MSHDEINGTLNTLYYNEIELCNVMKKKKERKTKKQTKD